PKARADSAGEYDGPEREAGDSLTGGRELWFLKRSGGRAAAGAAEAAVRAEVHPAFKIASLAWYRPVRFRFSAEEEGGMRGSTQGGVRGRNAECGAAPRTESSSASRLPSPHFASNRAPESAFPLRTSHRIELRNPHSISAPRVESSSASRLPSPHFASSYAPNTPGPPPVEQSCANSSSSHSSPLRSPRAPSRTTRFRSTL